jgi:hypothetical protein
VICVETSLIFLSTSCLLSNTISLFSDEVESHVQLTIGEIVRFLC